MEEKVAQLVEVINRLGADDRQRAQRLGVSIRTLTEYKSGRFPRIVQSLLGLGIVNLESEHATENPLGDCRDAA